jgi:hypothetical protein
VLAFVPAPFRFERRVFRPGAAVLLCAHELRTIPSCLLQHSSSEASPLRPGRFSGTGFFVPQPLLAVHVVALFPARLFFTLLLFHFHSFDFSTH